MPRSKESIRNRRLAVAAGLFVLTFCCLAPLGAFGLGYVFPHPEFGKALPPEANAATPTLALTATAAQKPTNTPIPSFAPTSTRKPSVNEQEPTTFPTVPPTAALTREPAPSGEFTLDATNVKFDQFTGQPIKCLVDPKKIWQSYWQLPLAEGQTWSKIKALQVKISIGDMERTLQIQKGQLLMPIQTDDPQKVTEGLPLPPETEGNLLKVNIFTDNNPTRATASYQKDGKWIQIGQQFPIYRTETGAMGGKDLCR